MTKLNATWSTVNVPNVGVVRFRTSRETVGRCLNVTVSRDALGWHLSFACEREIVPSVHLGLAVGIDVGVVRTMALSDGTFRDLPTERLHVLARRAKRAQRAGARGQRDSKRNAFAKMKVAWIRRSPRGFGGTDSTRRRVRWHENSRWWSLRHWRSMQRGRRRTGPSRIRDATSGRRPD
ncbi:hypothetical protein [uncultured Methylobacterium sp.]|uniref:hypothetical protein n=1 Tax=uncultured Methylobacterium sp. TaxID=157278 RepID=UPI002597A3BA|nr:hypothetical protein [uncultured Methylobacterium sp.]